MVYVQVLVDIGGVQCGGVICGGQCIYCWLFVDDVEVGYEYYCYQYGQCSCYMVDQFNGDVGDQEVYGQYVYKVQVIDQLVQCECVDYVVYLQCGCYQYSGICWIIGIMNQCWQLV